MDFLTQGMSSWDDMELLSSPAPSWRSSGFASLLLSLVPAALLGRASR